MTRNEALILAALMPAEGEAATWRRPMDFGGEAGSHHAVTARRMVPKGWVERRQRASPSLAQLRPSYEFRITLRGVIALANHKAGRSLLSRPGLSAAETAEPETCR